LHVKKDLVALLRANLKPFCQSICHCLLFRAEPALSHPRMPTCALHITSTARSDQLKPAELVSWKCAPTCDVTSHAVLPPMGRDSCIKPQCHLPSPGDGCTPEIDALTHLNQSENSQSLSTSRYIRITLMSELVRTNCVPTCHASGRTALPTKPAALFVAYTSRP
jgi:hypothetical protein